MLQGYTAYTVILKNAIGLGMSVGKMYRQEFSILCQKGKERFAVTACNKHDSKRCVCWRTSYKWSWKYVESFCTETTVWQTPKQGGITIDINVVQLHPIWMISN